MDVDKENTLSLSLTSCDNSKKSTRKAESNPMKRTFGTSSKPRIPLPKDIPSNHQYYTEVAFKDIVSLSSSCNSENKKDKNGLSKNVSTTANVNLNIGSTDRNCEPRRKHLLASSGSNIYGLEQHLSLASDPLELEISTQADYSHLSSRNPKWSKDVPMNSTNHLTSKSLDHRTLNQTFIRAKFEEEHFPSSRKRRPECNNEQEDFREVPVKIAVDKAAKNFQQEENVYAYKRQQLEHSGLFNKENPLINDKTFDEGVDTILLDKILEARHSHAKNSFSTSQSLHVPGYNVLSDSMESQYSLKSELRKLGEPTLCIASGKPNGASPNESRETFGFDEQCFKLGVRFPAQSITPKALSTFSSGGPSLPQSFTDARKPGNISVATTKHERASAADSDWGKFLALSTADMVQSRTEKDLPCQQRFQKLQAYLRKCEEPNDNILRSMRFLSSDGRSELAVELERRAITLSLLEGRELQRMKMLNVFGKGFTQSTRQTGATPPGHRLPAPAF